jgi:hypothetical protein
MEFMHRMIVPVPMVFVDDVDETPVAAESDSCVRLLAIREPLAVEIGTSADCLESSMKPAELVPNSTKSIKSMYFLKEV